MHRLTEAGKDSEGASRSASSVHAFVFNLLLPSAGESGEATSTFVLSFTVLDRDYLKDVFGSPVAVGFGRWHCHSPGSEGCWRIFSEEYLLIFVEKRHHKNL